MSLECGINQTHVLSNVSSDLTRQDPRSIAIQDVKEQSMSVILSAAPDTRRRPRRAGRGTGRQTRPQARPPRPLRGPQLGPDAAVATWGCDAAPAAPPVRWRLTERGITFVATVVIAVGLAIATAALVMVGLTALRVTGDSYVPAGQIQTLR
jgi:hypothetical protein